MLKVALFPVGLAYQSATSIRNLMYDFRIRKTRKVDAAVLSIGNLTVGGTGKTPMTLAMIDQLKKRKKTCGVVSRGYKRGQKGVLEVDISPRAALSFGDEPSLIKNIHPDIPVFVGERRVAAAEALLARKPVDVIICDDAFQHRSLHRDLNFLLLDVTEPIRNYRVLPVGRARESLQPALNRADIIVLTKTNLVEPEQLETFKSWLSTRLTMEKPIVQAEYVLSGFRALTGAKSETLTDPVLLVSGIAKPDALVKTLNDRVKILKHKIFPDHHRYTDLEVEIMLDEASQMQARWILTTAKDAMKLGPFPRLKERLWIVELGIKFSGDLKEMNEALDRLGRKGE